MLLAGALEVRELLDSQPMTQHPTHATGNADHVSKLRASREAVQSSGRTADCLLRSADNGKPPVPCRDASPQKRSEVIE